MADNSRLEKDELEARPRAPRRSRAQMVADKQARLERLKAALATDKSKHAADLRTLDRNGKIILGGALIAEARQSPMAARFALGIAERAPRNDRETRAVTPFVDEFRALIARATQPGPAEPASRDTSTTRDKGGNHD